MVAPTVKLRRLKVQPGDVIVGVNQARVATAKEARDRIAHAPKTAPILLEIKRGDRTHFVAIERGGGT